MHHGAIREVLVQLRHGLAGGQTDAQLLDRFIAHRDEAAFAELVQRHGPKVYAVCRRVLGQHHLAEDAFQAAFVVLAKKAGSIKPRSAVGGFLYGVARNAALEAFALRRRRKEILVEQVPDSRTAAPIMPDSDALAMLDEEIVNLSEKYRAAVVLCEIDGVSRAEAARQLGISEGTLSSRLAAARKQLAARLKSRGVVLSVGMFTGLAASADAVAPPALAMATATVSAIAGGVMRTMLLAKLKTAVLLCVIGLALGAFWMQRLTPAALSSTTPTSAAIPAPKEVNDAGLIWLHERDGNRLIAYSPAAEVVHRLDLPKDQVFLGLTPDGTKILYAAESGGKQTYHLRELGSDTPGTDLGLDYSPHDLPSFWNRGGTKFIRRRSEDPKKMVGVRSTILTYDVFDVQSKTTIPIEHPANHWVLGWAPDQKQFVTYYVGEADDKRELYFTTGKGEPVPLKRVGDRVLANDVNPANDDRTLLMGGVTRTPPRQPWHHALWKFDVTTGKVTELIHEEGHGYTEARWSPDCSRLCMMWGFAKDPDSSNGWDERRLTFAKADGTSRKTITLRDKAKGESINGISLVGWYPSPPKIRGQTPKGTPKKEPPPPLQESLNKLDAMRKGFQTKYDEVEKFGLELLDAYTKPEERTKIHFMLAHVYGQSGIDRNPDRVTKYARLALEHERDPIQRAWLNMYLGCAAEVDPTLGKFPAQRKEAARRFLRSYKEMLALKLPATAPELPALQGSGKIESNDPIESAQARANNDAYMKARKEAEYLREMVHHRDVLFGQCAQLYRREPSANDELRQLAEIILKDRQLAEDFLTNVKRWKSPAERGAPAKPAADPEAAIEGLEKLGVQLERDKNGLVVQALLPSRFGRFPEAFAHLQLLPKLAWLTCNGDSLFADDFKQIATLASLEEFELNANRKCQPLPWKILRGVRCIRLAGEGIDDSLLEAISEMPAVTSIHMNQVAVTPDGLAHLKRFPNLESVLIQVSKVTADGVNRIGDVKKLTSLTLSGNDIGADGFGHLGKLTGLTYLNLEKTGCTDDRVSLLKPLANLTDLDLGYNPDVSDAGLRHLVGLKKLGGLRLYGTGVTDDGVAELKKALPKLIVGK